MRRPDDTLERIRPLAGPVLLGVFLLAAQLTPLLHLAAHRNDHSHGPEAAADHDHGEPADLEHHNDDTTPAAPHPSNDHGQASSAHFGLALLEAPPPPFLPPPADTLAVPPDVRLRRHHATAQPQPPVRGPPRLS